MSCCAAFENKYLYYKLTGNVAQRHAREVQRRCRQNNVKAESRQQQQRLEENLLAAKYEVKELQKERDWLLSQQLFSSLICWTVFALGLYAVGTFFGGDTCVHW